VTLALDFFGLQSKKQQPNFDPALNVFNQTRILPIAAKTVKLQKLEPLKPKKTVKKWSFLPIFPFR
jgi:hypothetical protein